jgi:hypothetical protein
MNTNLTKGNFVKFSRMAAVGTAMTRRNTVTGIALTTLLAFNGMALAVGSSSATASYGKASTSLRTVEANIIPKTVGVQAQGEAAIQVAVTDSLTAVAARKPVQFKATVKALTPYVVQRADGTVAIAAPVGVLLAVDRDSYAAILGALNKANQIVQGNGAGVNRRLPPIPYAQIWEAVKRAGNWVWYKTHLCAAAVVREWGNITSRSPNPQDWIMDAAVVCGLAMRK